MSKMPDETSEFPREEGISLRELTEAFAQAMGDPAEAQSAPGRSGEQAPDAKATVDDQISALPDEQPLPQQPDIEQPEIERAEDGSSCRVSPRTILEAMLFVGNRENRPLCSRRAAELMRGVEASEIPALVDHLNRDYAANGCPYHIASEGSGYRLVLHKRFYPLRNRFYGRVRQARLSQAATDVLAIVAYGQPLSAEHVSRLRGKPSSRLLAQLVRRRLLRIERPAPGNTVVYYTSERFLRLFGLKSLDELPQSEEIETQ